MAVVERSLFAPEIDWRLAAAVAGLVCFAVLAASAVLNPAFGRTAFAGPAAADFDPVWIGRSAGFAAVAGFYPAFADPSFPERT